ncbi:MAG: DHA2 family efflux MFS transporter permease subunit [Methanothrix sp.]|nr:DHA2 family efflux MFS transporter permease subunit [Methanothrix sp.]
MTIEDHPKKDSFRLILLVVCASIFMANLDTTIVNISLPTISRYFDVGTGEISWISLSYFLAVTSLLLAFGRLGDLLGFRKLFLSGISIFAVSSFLCALAPGISEMVLFRILQGIGGGIMVALGPAIISAFLPQAIRGKALGYVMASAAIGIAIGPVIGGFLTAYIGWRWIFLVNVPLGIAATLIGYKALPGDQPTARGNFDLLGAALIFSSLAMIIYGLNQGKELGWGSSAILGSFSLGVLCAVGFIIREKRYSEPLVDLNLFNNLNFVLPNLGALLMLLAFAGALFALPFYMELGLGFSTAVASLFLTITSLAAAVSAPIGGAIFDRRGPRLACLTASASTLLAFLLFFLLDAGGLQKIVLAFALALMGIGYGMYAPPALSTVVSQCPNKRGLASSIMMTSRDMGVIAGIALFETIFSAATQGPASIHQTSAQTIALGFHHAVALGIAATLMALIISSMIKDKASGSVSASLEPNDADQCRRT